MLYSEKQILKQSNQKNIRQMLWIQISDMCVKVLFFHKRFIRLFSLKEQKSWIRFGLLSTLAK